MKVANEMRVLIREIKFYDEVNTITFLNNSSDLLVGHGGKLSKISHKDYINQNDLYCSPDKLNLFYNQKFPLTDAYLEDLKISKKLKPSRKP